MDEWLRRVMEWARRTPLLAGILAGSFLVGFPLVGVLMAADVPRLSAVVGAGLAGGCAALGTIWLLSSFGDR